MMPNETLLVIDAGTAVTIDWLDNDGIHQGGWIIPGLSLQQNVVVNSTVKVKNTENFQAQFKPGIDTASALQNGCLASVIGAIQIAYKTKPVQKIVLTGGDSLLLAEHLDGFPIVVEPMLIFQGLSNYCQS